MAIKKFDDYLELRAHGATSREAGHAVGISQATVERYEKAIRQGRHALERNQEENAQSALRDFEYFRYRYFGRRSTPWQTQAGYQMRDILTATQPPDKAYVCVNVAPGSGKSTLFCHDIPAWLAVQNRAIRCLIGSRTERQAIWYVNRLRRTFDRTRALENAEAVLAQDFGTFRPFNKDLWRSNEFVLAQEDDILLEDKEPSFSAYGMDSGFLGGRFDLVIWDDLVDKHTTRTVETREKLIHWWETEAETRVEPGGLLILQGQRLGPEDLYRYALDLTHDDGTPKYTHITYRAHYEEKCEKNHGNDQPPWPEGCLLDPARLPWRELAVIQRNRLDRYRILYQQEDVDPANALVNPIWIEGGLEGQIEHPGCWDDNRAPADPPRLPDLISVVAVDPSPTKQWAAIWVAYHPPTNQYFLLDLYNGPLTAAEFLDWNYQTGRFTGLMDEWQVRSHDLGTPITHWIVEANAAQRFLLAYEHVKRFQSTYGVEIIPHQTNRNKNDPNYGVQSIAPHFQFGRMRIPAAAGGKQLFDIMVREVTRWPEGNTDDTVMALWMAVLNLPNLWVRQKGPHHMWRPSWMNGTRGLEFVR